MKFKSVLFLLLLAVMTGLMTQIYADDEDEKNNLRDVLISDNPLEFNKNFALLPHIMVGGGYNNNVFNSPAIVNNNSNAMQAGGLFDLELGLGVHFRLNDTKYLEAAYVFKRYDYPQYAVILDTIHEGNIDFVSKPNGDTKWKINADIRRKNQIGTGILGNVLTQNYSYLYFSGDVAFYHYFRAVSEKALARKTLLKIDLTQKYYNYDEPAAPLLSLDSLEEKLDVSLTPYLGEKWKINIDISQRFRHYLNALAYDVNGTTVPGIKRQKYYTQASFVPELELVRNFSIYLGYGFTYRLDPYVGYYSYISHVIEAGLKWKSSINTEVGIDLAYEFRNYPVKIAAAVNAPLFYQYYDIKADVTQPILPWFKIFAELDITKRDSNAEDTTRTVLRAYQQWEIISGIKIEV